MPHEPRIPGLRRWVRLPRPVEHDVDNEITFHLESRAHDLVSRGVPAERARAMAEAEFGDIRASQRELAAVDRHRRRRERLERAVDAATHDLRFATRSLRRSPAFSSAAFLTLVVGIGACIAIFAVVDGVLLRPLPYAQPDRLVGAWHNMPPIGLHRAGQSASTYFTYQRLAHTIGGIGIYNESAVNVAVPGQAVDPQRITSALVTASLLRLLGVAPIRGRIFTDAEDRDGGPLVLLISEGLWRARFGAEPGIIGRVLDVDGALRRIVGVMPDRFRFPTAATQLWLPLALDPVRLDANAFTHWGIARLRTGVTTAAAERDFASLLPRVSELYPNFVPGISTQAIMEQVKPKPVLAPLREDLTGGVASMLWTVAASGALVLLVACANVANLMLVRADARRREMAVHQALGAGRIRVALRFFAESAVLAGLAGVAGLGLATVATRWLVAAGPESLPRLTEVRIDASALLFTVMVTAIVAVVCAVAPALRVIGDRRPLIDGNRGGTTGRVHQRVRGGLVVGQIALALVVLSVSGLLVRTFNRLHAVRAGFDPTHLATFWMSLPPLRYRSDTMVVEFFSALTDRVAHLPGVTAVAVSSRLPLEPYGVSQFPLYPDDDRTWVNRLPPLQIFSTISGDYFRAMRIPLLAGKTFAGMTAQMEGDAIVSQKTATYFWKDSTGAAALGKRFRPLPNSPPYTVIGVVRDARDTALAADPSPSVYFPEVAGRDSVSKQLRRTMALVVRTAGDPTAVMSSVQRIVHDLNVTLPMFQVKPMTDAFSASMAQLTFIIIVLGSAAIVTLVLGTVGLYGVLAYLVTLRTRELGMRIALGATPRAIAVAMTQYGVALTALGIASGAIAFAFIARFLRALLFGVTPNDPLTLISAATMLLLIATFASWIPARRASRIDPADALRVE